MKKLLSLLTVSALVLSLTACSDRGEEATETETDVVACETDGNTVCYDEAAGMYAIEDGAVIRLSVDNDNWGTAIVAAWDAAYPDYAGLVVYENEGSSGLADRLTEQQGEAVDIALIIDAELQSNLQTVFPLDTMFAEYVEGTSIPTIDSYVGMYAPLAYDSMSFAWNKTMMETLGLDTTVNPENGLPEAYDTWEEIFALAEAWQTERPTYKDNQVNVVFPVSLDEPWSGHSTATQGGGWRLFSTGDATMPGFDAPEFVEGLQFIVDASAAQLSVETSEAGETVKSPGASMGWRWDNVLNEEISPFGLVGTWMDVNGAEAATGSDFKFGLMPTYKGNTLSPFMKTKGFVINGFTQYPSAAHAVMEFLYSPEGLNVMVNNSTYVPALVDGASNTPTEIDENKLEMSFGMSKNFLEPTITLPNNPAVKAMDVYYSIGINDFYKQIWDGEITPEEAQATIVELADAWLAENN
jgi:arabinogalactan oligomer/maltooligosaccharide transport system substrate-binding protein